MLPTLFGGIGGLLNALLLWLQVPEKVADFRMVILPCGAFHGAVLACCAVLAANVARRAGRMKLLAWLAAGYVGGWISWIPSHHLLADHPLIKSLLWPFQIGSATDAAWRPFQYFGLVSLILAATLSLMPSAPRRAALGFRMAGVTAGILGSLWFWSLMESHARWAYLSMVHGSIWGLVVGAAISRARKT